MFRRASAVTAVLVAVAIVGSGCAGNPAPVETTADALSEEEAFAAAEETYRAYVDALNQVDLSDPETFEPVYALTTGEANAGLRKEFSEMHANGWSMEGASTATLVQHAEHLAERVTLAVCLDVSEVAITDNSGSSVVSPNRRDVQPMTIRVNTDRANIDSIEARDGGPMCDGE